MSTSRDQTLQELYELRETFDLHSSNTNFLSLHIHRATILFYQDTIKNLVSTLDMYIEKISKVQTEEQINDLTSEIRRFTENAQPFIYQLNQLEKYHSLDKTDLYQDQTYKGQLYQGLNFFDNNENENNNQSINNSNSLNSFKKGQ